MAVLRGQRRKKRDETRAMVFNGGVSVLWRKERCMPQVRNALSLVLRHSDPAELLQP